MAGGSARLEVPGHGRSGVVRLRRQSASSATSSSETSSPDQPGCELCLRESNRYTVHHLVPKAAGGKLALEQTYAQPATGNCTPCSLKELSPKSWTLSIKSGQIRKWLAICVGSGSRKALPTFGRAEPITGDELLCRV